MEALRRYTNLPAVLAMLRSQAITLLPPDTWDDMNDRRLLETYRRGRGLESVLCLCFAQAAETYHHWKVFSPGTDGMCVVFDKHRLLASLPKVEVQHRSVKYFKVQELSATEPALDDLPFAKRIAYKPEAEFRLLWTSATEKAPSRSFNIPVTAIERLIINPWLPKQLTEAIQETVRSIPDFATVEVLQSTVTDGPAWKRLADQYA